MKNVIILAMSTFKRKDNIYTINPSDYQYTNQPKHSYLSSNSPIIHIMMQEYSDQDLVIILLATKATQQEHDVIVDDTQEKHFHLSPVEFLKYELAEAYHLESPKRKGNEEIFIRGSHKVTFLELSLDLKDQYKTINETVNIINSINIRDGIERLWIDPHGGLRDVNITMLGILSLLHNFQITPEYVFDLKYDNNIAIINNNDEIYAIYDFVSAMNTFYNSQNADLLIDYFNSTAQEKYPAAKQTANALKVISDGLQFCNPELYKNGVTQLGNVLDDLYKDNSYFSLFKDFIEDEFLDVLIDGEFKPLRAIESCMRNALYQQALTFIESFMPEQYAYYHLLYFSDDDIMRYEDYKKGNKVKNINEPLNKTILNKLRGNVVLKEKTVKNSQKNKVKNVKNETEDKPSLQNIPLINKKLKNIDISQVEDKSFMIPEITFDFLSFTNKPNTLPNGNKSNEIFKYTLLSNLKKTDSYYHEAILSIIMLCVIIQVRNKVNHGNSTVLDYDEIIDFLKYYIQITKDLFERIRRVKNGKYTSNSNQ